MLLAGAARGKEDARDVSVALQLVTWPGPYSFPIHGEPRSGRANMLPCCRARRTFR